jgi:hypothetical protein
LLPSARQHIGFVFKFSFNKKVKSHNQRAALPSAKNNAIKTYPTQDLHNMSYPTAAQKTCPHPTLKCLPAQSY